MAMTKASMASKIIAKITAANPNMKGADAAIITPWLEAFCEGIIEEIQQNSDIVMDPADFNVLPGTFNVGGAPVAGLGDNAALNLTGKIQ